MKVLRHLESLRHETAPLVVAAGFFDGVHLGHQAILRRGHELAGTDGQVWVLTLDNHPLLVLRADPPPLLTCNKHKLLLLRRYGASGCLLLPFTRKFAAMQAREFLASLFASASGLRAVVVGEDWRFGRGGGGDVALLREVAAEAGVIASSVPPVHGRSGALLSSTRIRAAVTAGSLDAAADMLGRPFSILGTVVHGDAIGRQIGFPTANLSYGSEAVPPPGVYAVHAAVGGAIADGVINFGTRPTIRCGSHEPRVELHVMDFEGDLYGQDIEVFFIERLRDEALFASRAALAESIRSDVDLARRVLAAKKLKESLYRHCFGIL